MLRAILRYDWRISVCLPPVIGRIRCIMVNLQPSANSSCKLVIYLGAPVALEDLLLRLGLAGQAAPGPCARAERPTVIRSSRRSQDFGDAGKAVLLVSIEFDEILSLAFPSRTAGSRRQTSR